MIKFIAADLDGTLLDSEKQLPKGFFELVKQLRLRGVTFAAASGRQYYGVLKLFEPVMEYMVFIAENGGIAFENGKMLYSMPMPDEDVLEIIAEAEKLYSQGVRVLLSGEKSAYVKDSDPLFAEHCAMYCGRLERVSSFDMIPNGDHIIKIAVFDENAENRSYPVLKNAAPLKNVILSNSCWVDIVRSDVNKGAAVEKLMDRLGASYEEAAVFGDYMNDYEMMSRCRYSYAMENAHPDLKKAANFIAPSNDDNGVVREILKLVPFIEYDEGMIRI